MSGSTRKLTDTAAGQSIFVGLWIAGTLVFLSAAAGAFLLGQNIADTQVPPVVVVEQEPAPIEFPVLSGIPQAPGVWEWNELRGGECIRGFEGPFAENYTVVDCGVPHDAQLLRAELLSRSPSAVYPGVDELTASAREICDLTEDVDYSLAQDYSDLIVEFSYPVTPEQWETGQRGVYCFVMSQSGQQLEGDFRP
jgi:hypothetical protein